MDSNLDVTYRIRVGLDRLDKRYFYWQILDGSGGCLGDGTTCTSAAAVTAASERLLKLITRAAYSVELI